MAFVATLNLGFSLLLCAETLEQSVFCDGANTVLSTVGQSKAIADRTQTSPIPGLYLIHSLEHIIFYV